LLEASNVKRLVAELRPDAIVHLAWIATPGVYWTSPENHAWRRATLALARAAAETGVRRFVGAGSCAEYDWSGGYCDEATTALRPATLYGQSKLAAWRDVERLARPGFSAAWGRIFNVFGENEHPGRLVPSVALALLKGEPVLCTHGQQIRDFLHVEDAGDAFAALVTSQVEGALNIASGEGRQVREVIEGVANKMGRPDLVRLGARPASDAMSITASIGRLSKEVGWSPRLTFDEALNRTVGYWRARATMG
jgi:nucleoside-diphosphate-sugar epimerase